MQNKRNANWVVVTGGSGGIGKALIDRLATEGLNVVATARNPGRISTAAGPGSIVGIELDMLNSGTFETAAHKVAEVIGNQSLSGLVNMAGVIVEGPIEAVPPTELRRQFEVNVVGPVVLTQALLPMLKRARGRIVNIGAISAHLTVPFYGPIAASKSALAALNDAMRLEFAQFGIDVTLIEPGAMKTRIFSTSRAARDASLSMSAEHERLYRPALQAMDRAFEKVGADDPEVVVAAIMAALFRKRPKPRVVVGKGTGALLVLSHLPIGLRDRVIKNALGLSALLRRTGASAGGPARISRAWGPDQRPGL
jgi:NAD(P)-dependent dehydrogenase (short-subunit alcohol dehydrogenase family)